MSVNEKINKSLNFLPHQHLILKAKFHEDTTNALQPAYPGSGCNISHANLYTFTQNKTVTKYQTADYLIQALQRYKYITNSTTLIFSLEFAVHLYIPMYISRMSYAVLSNNIQDLQPLYELVTLHQLRELQCSNEHKRVSVEFMSESVPRDSTTYLH